MAGAFQGVHLELHSTVDVLEEVQQIAEDVCRQVGLDEETSHWTSMAVRETVVNAITHGNKNNPEKLVIIDFHVNSDHGKPSLVVTVRDQGEGFESADIVDPLAPENILNTSGRGIFLVRQFMDEVSIQRATQGGTQVRMLKHL
jgi:serine/threonine-protein kinase RsbW